MKKNSSLADRAGFFNYRTSTLTDSEKRREFPSSNLIVTFTCRGAKFHTLFKVLIL